jgi:hypothetical protein
LDNSKNRKKKFMQKRAYERIPASLVVKYLHRGSICYGLVTDISGGGMCINTSICFPSNSSVKLMLPLKNEVLELSAKVRRVLKTEKFYEIMGVEVLNPPHKYLQIVEHFRTVSVVN